MKRLNLELMVGLFIVLGFAAFVFSALQAANLGNLNVNAHTYTVTARFDNIGGLKPRASVKSAGVVVGRVKSVTFDQETFQAKVEISVDSRYLFPVDSSLRDYSVSSTSGFRPAVRMKTGKTGRLPNARSRLLFLKTSSDSSCINRPKRADWTNNYGKTT